MPIPQDPSIIPAPSVNSESFPASPRRSHIYFPPADYPSHSHPQNAPQRAPALSSKSQSARKIPMSSQKAGPSTNKRRRVQSTDTADVFLDSPRLHRKSVNGLLTPPRGLDSLTEKAFEPIQGDNPSFSDEYDLCEFLLIRIMLYVHEKP